MLVFCTSICWARLADVGGSMRKLIETDWIEHDRQSAAESYDFPLQQSKQHIKRGYGLAERLRSMGASNTDLEQSV